MDNKNYVQEELVLNENKLNFDEADWADSIEKWVAEWLCKSLKLEGELSKCLCKILRGECNLECRNKMKDLCVCRMGKEEVNLFHEFTDEDYYYRFIWEVKVSRTLDELAKVVLTAVYRGKLTEKRVVQSAFIELLLPFCQPMGRGKRKPSVWAVRTHINKILYEDRERRRMQKMQKNAGVH